MYKKIIKSSFTAAFQLIFVEEKPCSVQYCPTVANLALKASGKKLIVAKQEHTLSLHGKTLGKLDGHNGLAGTGTPPDKHIVKVLQDVQCRTLAVSQPEESFLFVRNPE